MRVFILEPSAIAIDRTHGAKSLLGHTKALSSAGIDSVWLTNVNSKINSPKVSIHQVFDYTIYDDVRKKRGRFLRRICAPIYAIKTRIAAKGISRVLLQENTSTNDHVFVPTTDWLTFQAILKAFKARELKGRVPVLHLLIMYEQADWMTGGYPYQKIVELIKTYPGKLFVYTETKRHAERLAQMIEMPVSSYPWPCFNEPREPGNLPTDPTICFVGGGRRDKGFGLIPGIVAKFNANAGGEGARFIVQSPRPEDRLDAEVDQLKQYSNVQLLKNLISEEEYQAYLQSCSVLVFPYLKKIYFARGSAIVNESVASSIPFVCTRDTSLAEMLEENNGKVADGESEFSVAIRDLLDNYSDYSAAARRMADKYRNRLLQSPLVLNIKNSEI